MVTAVLHSPFVIAADGVRLMITWTPPSRGKSRALHLTIDRAKRIPAGAIPCKSCRGGECSILVPPLSLSSPVIYAGTHS